MEYWTVCLVICSLMITPVGQNLSIFLRKVISSKMYCNFISAIMKIPGRICGSFANMDCLFFLWMNRWSIILSLHSPFRCQWYLGKSHCLKPKCRFGLGSLKLPKKFTAFCKSWKMNIPRSFEKKKKNRAWLKYSGS